MAKAMMWHSLALFLVSFHSAAAHKFLAGSSDQLLVAEMSAPESAVEMPKVSRKAQKCFTKVIFGTSPGSNMGSSTETSVDDCLSKCARLEGCLAMTFRLEDGLCKLLHRTYEGKYEESDEMVVANKLFSCKASQAVQVFEEEEEEVFEKAEVGIKVSEEAQKSFTKVVFGKSPGSNLGNSMETSVDNCMLKCAALEGCLAMSFRLSDGLCNFLNRTYDGKFEESDERLMANKIDSAASQDLKPFDKMEVAVSEDRTKVSETAQNCFTTVKFGRSPGSNMGNSTETSVDACMLKCAALQGCLAMTFRLEDGLCNFLDRTYDGKFEESEERLLANKLDTCEVSQEVQVLDNAAVVYKMPKVSKKAQKCFTKVTFGKSPGGNLGNSTETSVDSCMAKCAALEGCLAMTFRLNDGLCNFLNRTYDDKYEESDERVLANKLDGCKPKTSHEVEEFDKETVGIKVSEEAQECFTNIKFGRSPGSNVGNSTENSVDECLLKCAPIQGCMAVTFRMSDGLCNYLDRTYEDKYEESDERVLANKKDSCKTKPSGFLHKVYDILTFPFRKLASLFSNIF